MTDQLPVDIEEAIEALITSAEDNARYVVGGVSEARDALDAVILKHLRATDQTNTGE